MLGREIDPINEVLVTSGANGALHAFISAYVNKGDELVAFEPLFPMVADHTEVAGGSVNGVKLSYREGKWTFDPEELRRKL